MFTRVTLRVAKGLEKNWPGEDVGCDRKYESMVFHVGPNLCECGCGMPAIDDWGERDFGGYNTAAEATKGHMALCQKWAKEPDLPQEVDDESGGG